MDRDTCATDNQLINTPLIEDAFARLWANSSPGAPQPQRKEQAAWIVKTPAGQLQIVPFTDVDYGPCTVSPRIGSFQIPMTAVGWIHTHPFTDGEVQTSCDPIGTDEFGRPAHGEYDGMPNEDDIALAALINHNLKRNIDSYYIDGSRIVRFVATGPTTVSGFSRYGRCGY